MILAAAMPAFGGPVLFSIPGGASSFGLLGGPADGVSNTGTSVVVGNVGGIPTVTGFQPTGPGMATGFACTPTGPASCSMAQETEVTTAYNDIFGAGGAFITGEGLTATQPAFSTLTTSTTFTGNNVYQSTGDISTATGITFTFDAQGNSAADFVIKIEGALTVNGALTFMLENGAQASNIFWIVTDAATISVGSAPSVGPGLGSIVFDGDILAGTSFTMSAATGGSGTLAGTINGCVFSQTTNTLMGETNVNGCGATGASVPEPATLTLVGGALLGLGVLRRKKVFRQ